MDMTVNNLLVEYQNGNVSVKIYEDGTKVREFKDIPEIIHPESIDVKITNYCDLGCEYCHENSTTKGSHCNINTLLNTLGELPKGIELAIGGGNPLAHPNIEELLTSLKERGFICNITVNQGHLEEYYSLVNSFLEKDLIKGLGISTTNTKDLKVIKILQEKTNNIVFHLIVGINTFEDIKLLGVNKKFLLLGYKTFGRGIKFFDKKVEEGVKYWKDNIRIFLGKVHLSFDNLAIEQLEIQKHLTEEAWSKFYMGDDFTFTMYIDAVKEQYAPTSRSSYKERVNFKDKTLIGFFKTRKKNETD